MRVREKLLIDYKTFLEKGAITIVAFGDSVTYGALNFDEVDFDTVYHRLLAQRISAVKKSIPVNMINAGIGGTSALQSLERFESQVLARNPDAVIVAFGLNDVNGTLENYLKALKIIFSECLSRGIETVFLTPNMLNTYVTDTLPELYREYATRTADFQNNGRMDTYIDEARKLAHSMGIGVADCYAKWREMSKTQDTTRLLANGINHPTREMHKLFADELFKVFFAEECKECGDAVNTMYQEET